MNGNEVIYELQKSLASALRTIEEQQDKIVSLQFSLIGVKSQTAKEFAERLKARAINRYNEFDEQEYPRATITDIDETLKEMGG